MATQEDFDRLQAAFAKADAAVDANPNDTEALEDARAFAAEIRRLTGQAGAQPQAAPAPQQPAPQPEADTYLSRSVDGLKRMLGTAIGEHPGQDAVTGLKAMAQGIPFVGTKTDNAYAAVRSAITGEDEGKLQKEYMAPVEQMNPYARGALQVAGGMATPAIPGVGSVVSALATKPMWMTPVITAIESMISGPGRRDNGKPFVQDMVENAPADAVVGAVGGAGGMIAANLLSRGIMSGANIARAAQGKPTDPFVGRPGAAAQERVKAALEANPATPDKPLLSQPAGANLGKEVVEYGGPTAKAVVDAAKATMKDTSRTQQAGTAFQGLGLVPVGLRTTPGEIAKSPRINSNAVLSLLGHPDMKKVVASVKRDVRFDGVPEDNATFIHEVQTRLAKAAKGLRKDTPVKAENIDSLRAVFVDEIDNAIPGYKDALSGYRDAARETASAQEMAKAAGGNAKFVKSSVEARVPNIGQNVSGSFEGAKLRTAFNFASYLMESLGLTHTKEANKIIARLLVEKDPEQIAMILSSAAKQHGGKHLRPSTVFLGNSVLSPWRNQEAQ